MTVKIPSSAAATSRATCKLVRAACRPRRMSTSCMPRGRLLGRGSGDRCSEEVADQVGHAHREEPANHVAGHGTAFRGPPQAS
jgi:hypothetical protein